MASVKLPSLTVRFRLTLLHGVLFVVAGAMLLTLTYLFVVADRPVVRFPSVWISASTDVVRPSPGASQPPGLDLSLRPRAAGGFAMYSVQLPDANRLLLESGLAFVIVSAVSLGLGWLVAGRALEPVHTMTVAARRISDQNLDERLGIAGPNDELKELADTFDGMLQRLQEAFESQRRFVANASHELKTPLTFERTTLEVALADPDATAGSLREACERVLATTGQQERLIEALLTLARSQRGLDHREPCDLADLAALAIESTEDAARSAGIRLNVALRTAPTSGDTQLIERLVLNLLDNAIRYNSRHGWVEAHTALEAGQAVLRISNSGPLLVPEQLDRLFEPFMRSRSDRTSHEGIGLGLSIVAAIAAVHRASVTTVPRTEGGLDIVVSFPPASTPQPAA